VSDVPQGPDWWRASNGLYYPPEARPGQSRPTGDGTASSPGGGDDLASMPSPPDEAPPAPVDTPGEPAVTERVDEPTAGWGDDPRIDETRWDDDDVVEAEPAGRRWVAPALIIVLIVALVAGAGVWWLLTRDSDDEPTVDTATTTTDASDTTDTTETGDTTTTTEDDGQVSVYDLGVGDCFDTTEVESADGLVVSTVVLTECDEPHGAEVYATESIEAAEGDPFPGTEGRDEAARELCEPGFEEFVGRSTAESELVLLWLAPTEESWDDGDREVTCAVAAPDGERLTESVAGSER
jgi:hypothetical protein